MWSQRINLLKEQDSDLYDLLKQYQSNSGSDANEIFHILKEFFVKDDYWKIIAEIFSPIVLHLTSEIVREACADESIDDFPILKLFSNLLPSFPLIEPLIHYFFDHRPIHTSSYLYECQYLQSIFRILSKVGSSLQLQVSIFLFIKEELLRRYREEHVDILEETWFYLMSILGILQEQNESEYISNCNEFCSIQSQTQFYLNEKRFEEEEISLTFPNDSELIPIHFDTIFATTVDGVPFLRSLSSNISDITTLDINSISPYARSLALAMLTNKPVLIIGPPGSGKSSLIQQLANIAGIKTISLHLGSTVDAKSLLGGYICGDINGEFKWSDGPLTSAARNNDKWIILEQIEEASAEVIALLSPLLSEGKLFVPGRSETINIGYNTKIFATSFQPLESSLWTKIKIDFLNPDDLKKAILSSHPKIKDLLDYILNRWISCGN